MIHHIRESERDKVSRVPIRMEDHVFKNHGDTVSQNGAYMKRRWDRYTYEIVSDFQGLFRGALKKIMLGKTANPIVEVGKYVHTALDELGVGRVFSSRRVAR